MPPQWIQNVNAIVIVTGGFTMPAVFKRIRKHMRFSYPLQFTCSLLFIAIGFFMLVIGIHFAAANGLVAFYWIVISYFFQSIGELFIGPIGYAMIGLLATENLQGLMMGSWMLITGGSSGVIASFLSNYALAETHSSNPVLTNPGYSKMFLQIGMAAAIASAILLCLVPFLRRLINR